MIRERLNLFDDLSNQKAFFIDMDGVINKGFTLIPGAKEFVEKLKKGRYRFLFLTNNSYFTPGELRRKLLDMGIEVEVDNFYTSAMATASFIKYQKPGASAYVIGGKGLKTELESAGIKLTSSNPDYVVVGETEEYDYSRITEATLLIEEGAKFLATNPDITGPTPRGPVPACGALVAPIERVTGVRAYFLGKPNPIMMYWARKKLKVHTRNSFMIGDRMDTDIVGGLEAGMTCCLVLSGVTSMMDLARYPYQPDYIFESIADINPDTILSKWDRPR
ncbi:MAG TPA: HAD-IIA family hydrolase [Spirochaetota bacterium]|nr:MAG: Ribonucleotide monophosphatase NagD [Spirochaetes bacterium ADurb.Bin218]HOK03364.1 HAD-IIA family hydrolase [Spirochaetota bacterium]HOK93625.1 HAD-IIA family hydrolase [Spirochaetota bacterium]HON16863.1 HAD-IIA family hydrolase [Spirochaetota bacterium]HOQ12756.1 HAD-IIA family hydrolase [Spirochaetota bacterium]